MVDFIDDECEICGGSGRVSCYECGGVWDRWVTWKL